MPLDPRVHSDERLEPRHPLPHISRRALRRVKNPLPAPTECPYCSGLVELVSNSRIYNGREFGEWPYAFHCEPCDAYVGLHPHTDIPLGTLANVELRGARKVHKTYFQKVCETFDLGRTPAYQWLAGAMGIPVGECHFGWFNKQQCEQAGLLCLKRLQVIG